MAQPAAQPAAQPRKSYAQRAEDLAGLINRIALMNGSPHHWHETRDAAARAARALQLSLAADGL